MNKENENDIDVEKEMRTFRRKLYKKEPVLTFSFLNGDIGSIDIKSLTELDDVIEAFRIIDKVSEKDEKKERKKKFGKLIKREYENIIEVNFKKKK